MSTYSSTRRERVFIVIWLVYNLITILGGSLKAYSEGLGLWGQICGIATLITAVYVASKYFTLVTNTPAAEIMKNSFQLIFLGHIFMALSFWGGGLSVVMLVYPVALYMFFVENYYFLRWLDGEDKHE